MASLIRAALLITFVAVSVSIPGIWACAAEPVRRPNLIFILADDKYGQGIVNREFLSENKVFYHQSVESALAAI